MDSRFQHSAFGYQDPNLLKLTEIASKDSIDVSESLRVIANVLISMESFTLRNLRDRQASIDKWMIDFGKDFQDFRKDMEETRSQREALEIEHAKLILSQSRLSTSQKIKTALDARKVDWSAWWRDVFKSVTGFVIGGIAMAIVLYLLQNVFGK